MTRTTAILIVALLASSFPVTAAPKTDILPELDLSTNLQIIPNLTDTGRVRAELDISLKWEIVEDLFWQLSFYDSYDSDPIVADAEKNDYGVSTSLGWAF